VTEVRLLDLPLRLYIVVFVWNMLTKFEVCSCSYSGKIDEILEFNTRSMRHRLYPLMTYFRTADFLLIKMHLHAQFEAV